jgi:hypothetical protein
LCDIDASDNVCAACDGTNENASVGWTMKGRVIARSRLTNAECCHTETPTTGDDVDDNLIVDEFYYVPNSIRLVCYSDILILVKL